MRMLGFPVLFHEPLVKVPIPPPPPAPPRLQELHGPVENQSTEQQYDGVPQQDHHSEDYAQHRLVPIPVFDVMLVCDLTSQNSDD